MFKPYKTINNIVERLKKIHEEKVKISRGAGFIYDVARGELNPSYNHSSKATSKSVRYVKMLAMEICLNCPGFVEFFEKSMQMGHIEKSDFYKASVNHGSYVYYDGKRERISTYSFIYDITCAVEKRIKGIRDSELKEQRKTEDTAENKAVMEVK